MSDYIFLFDMDSTITRKEVLPEVSKRIFGKLVERQGRKAIGAKVRGISRMMPAGCFRLGGENLRVPETSKAAGVLF